MYKYRLRPHHALCLSFFEGKGYSEAFVDNMWMIKSSLKPEDQIQITFEGDSICQKCPNMKADQCASQEKVTGYDHRVATLCKWVDGQVMSYEAFIQGAYDEIIAPRKVSKVCIACQWMVICESMCPDKQES